MSTARRATFVVVALVLFGFLAAAYAYPRPTAPSDVPQSTPRAKSTTTSTTSPLPSIRVGGITAARDDKAPAITVSFPANDGIYNAAAYDGGCGTGGGDVCGTASDPSGVASVSIAIQRQTDGTFWNGTAFADSAPHYLVATGTTSWRYPLPMPAPNGAYHVLVRAADVTGNTTRPTRATSIQFGIDTVAPPVPVFTKTPDDATDETSANFRWNDAAGGGQFRCSLDGSAPSPCSRQGVEHKRLAVGDHCFRVVAVDAAGNVSAPREFCWTIVISGGFSVTGTVAGAFAPGVSQPVALTISNPYHFAIKVTSVSVAIRNATTKTGEPNPLCVGRENLSVVHSLTAQPTIPARSTRTLAQLGVAQPQWPLLQMPNLPINQDACKGTTFTVDYTGTATRP